MSTHKQTFFQVVLARISRGAVPVGGACWFDPKDAGAVQSVKPAPAPEAQWSPVSLSLSRPVRRP